MTYCDTTETRYRIENGIDNSIELINKFEKQLYMRYSNKYSIYFYVMLTDSKEMINYDNNDIPYFPGHTFLIEKLDGNNFKIYQSYINNYDLKKYMHRYECNSINGIQMKSIINTIKYICSNNNDYKWDESIKKNWKYLTDVDSENFSGTTIKGIHFCYKRFTTKQALHNVNSAMKSILRNKYIVNNMNMKDKDELYKINSELEYYM